MQVALEKNAPQEAKQSAGSVLQWISERTDWLMIYDGADGDYEMAEKLLPPGNGGNILITSRNMEIRRATLASLKVLNMAEEEAASLLLKSAALDGMCSYNCDLARKLASELGGIPIALDQAGAFMLTSQHDIANYLGLSPKHKHEILSNPEFKGASDYDRTTYGTWDISMKKIENIAEYDTGEKALAAQSAMRILRTFAFLDHVNIPLELFKNAAENYMKRDVIQVEDTNSNLQLSIKLLDYQTLFLSDEGVWEKLKFLAGIHVLTAFSLIEAHNQLYSMNPLVQAWIRHRVPKAEVTNCYCQTAALVSCSIDLVYSVDNYAFCKMVAPHIRSHALYASELELESTYYNEGYQTFMHVFHHVGSWDEMEKLLLLTAHQQTTELGANHPKTLASIADLALTYYRNQGMEDGAEKLEMVDVINAMAKAILGSDDPGTLTSMADLIRVG
jgi:hypothetical protein